MNANLPKAQADPQEEGHKPTQHSSQPEATHTKAHFRQIKQITFEHSCQMRLCVCVPPSHTHAQTHTLHRK